MPSEYDLSSNQTLQISDIRDTLGIREQDIPCLHFTYLSSMKKEFIALENIFDKSIYHFFQRIMIFQETNLNEIQKIKKEIQKSRSILGHIRKDRRYEKSLYEQEILDVAIQKMQGEIKNFEKKDLSHIIYTKMSYLLLKRICFI